VHQFQHGTSFQVLQGHEGHWLLIAQ